MRAEHEVVQCARGRSKNGTIKGCVVGKETIHVEGGEEAISNQDHHSLITVGQCNRISNVVR